MITERISLNIALQSLKKIENIEGKVLNIQMSFKNNIDKSVKTIVFDDILTIESYINKYAPIIPLGTEDCAPLNQFELLKFTIEKSGTNKNIVAFDGTLFKTKSANVNKITINNILNDNYLVNISEFLQVFAELDLGEYIKDQEGYIDCGYIEVHLQGSMIKLGKLYNKYKII